MVLHIMFGEDDKLSPNTLWLSFDSFGNLWTSLAMLHIMFSKEYKLSTNTLWLSFDSFRNLWTSLAILVDRWNILSRTFSAMSRNLRKNSEIFHNN